MTLIDERVPRKVIKETLINKIGHPCIWTHFGDTFKIINADMNLSDYNRARILDIRTCRLRQIVCRFELCRFDLRPLQALADY